MHCIDCDYALKKLESNRCPECGRPFDPQNPSTYRPVSSEHRKAYLVSEIKTTGCIFSMLLLVLIPPLVMEFGFTCWLILCLLLAIYPMSVCVVRIRRAIRGYKDDDV